VCGAGGSGPDAAEASATSCAADVFCFLAAALRSFALRAPGGGPASAAAPASATRGGRILGQALAAMMHVHGTIKLDRQTYWQSMLTA